MRSGRRNRDRFRQPVFKRKNRFFEDDISRKKNIFGRQIIQLIPFVAKRIAKKYACLCPRIKLGSVPS